MATPALSGPRSLSCESIAPRCSPRCSATPGDLAKRPAIPHMAAILVSPPTTASGFQPHNFRRSYVGSIHFEQSEPSREPRRRNGLDEERDDDCEGHDARQQIAVGHG